MLTLPFAPQTRLLMIKEIKTFFRDTSQWSQLILLLALVVVYVYNFSVLPLKGSPLVTFYFKNVIAFLNLALAGFVIASVAVRFVLPSVSLEGKSFWIAKTAPLPLRRLWWSKFWVGLVPLLVFGEVLVVATNYYLQVMPLMMWLSTLTLFCMTFGIVALGLAVGAAYPKFDADNAAKVAAGVGGLVYMILCMSFIGAVVVLEAWPVYAWFMSRLHETPLSVLGRDRCCRVVGDGRGADAGCLSGLRPVRHSPTRDDRALKHRRTPQRAAAVRPHVAARLLRGFQGGKRVTGPLAHRIEHRLDRARQIAVLLAQHILEQLQAIRVHQVLEDHRVVERTRRELLVRAGLQRQRVELVLGRSEELFPVIECHAVAVGRAQARREAHEEIGEHQRVPPVRRRLLHRFCIVAASEEQHGATVADEVGERLIEVGVPADVARVVQQLVDDHVGQRGAVVAQQIGQQRVGEPAERAERDGRADIRVVAVTFEVRRFLASRHSPRSTLCTERAQRSGTTRCRTGGCN